MSIELRLIDYKSEWYGAVLELRDQILRRPLGLILNDEDVYDDRNQYIVIGIKENVLVACVMLKILDIHTIKFRQMAVSNGMQGSGVGSMLMRFAENFCQLNEYKRIELHARKSAKGFYSRLGYLVIGEEFEEVGIPHVKMIKEL